MTTIPKAGARITGYEYSTDESENSKHFQACLGAEFVERIHLEAAELDLDGSVPKHIFLREMRRLWAGFKNELTPELEECWEGILHCFNRSIHHSGMNVSSATMGAGKTTSLLLFLALYSVLYPTKGALVVSRRKQEGEELSASLNYLLGSGTAIALNGDTDSKDKWKSNLERHQILFATHVRFLGSSHLKSNNHYTRFNGKRREVTIIDESLEYVCRHTISSKFIRSIKDRLGFYCDEYIWDDDFSSEMKLFSKISRTVAKYQLKSTDGEVVTDLFEAIREDIIKECGENFKFQTMFDKLYSFISSTKPDEWDGEAIRDKFVGKKKHSDFDFFEFQSTLVQDIISVQSTLVLKLWGKQDKLSGDLSIASGEIMKVISKMVGLDKDTQSCVILDGTSQIDLIYSYLQEAFSDLVYIQPEVKGIRNYDNVEFFVRSTSGTGKTVSTRRQDTRIEKILSWAEAEFNSRDRVVFCATKEFMEEFAETIEERKFKFKTVCMHYGCIDGRNDLAKYNTMVFLSIPNPPPNYHEQSAIALGLEDKYLSDDNYSKFIRDNDAAHVATTLSQAISRDTKRKVIEGGRCRKSRVYLLFTGTETKQDADFATTVRKLRGINGQIVKTIQTVYPGSKWSTWSSFSGWQESKQGKPPSKAVIQLIDYLTYNVKPGQTVRLDNVIFSMGLSEKEKDTVKRAVKNRHGRQIDVAFDKLGINVFTKPGKGGYTNLIKK